jgi:hypothetical protein
MTEARRPRFPVGNAGSAGPTATIEDCKPADWDRTARRHGVYLYCKRAADDEAARFGAIINMSSTAGIEFARRSPYCAAKWASSVCQDLALEAGEHGIRRRDIGAVEGDRMDRFFGPIAVTGRTIEELGPKPCAIRRSRHSSARRCRRRGPLSLLRS